ncbi:relaxase/mobilization nuclease domain-containing protein [Pontibacter pamirensis]|uniref:relaxase/mobilization nuclease domain-containing protein n=1 Tax=Pontibacter pamirensis TaxID=2562824 RepID=UPI0013899A2F|nr:relaxase/mobilization nuclease domain-containing protein [Pontibacter pamirensis]
MIVKILSSAATFSGVHYNEDKIAKGTAQLLASDNFSMLHLGPSGIADTDYKGYLLSWSRSEDNKQTVKQPQFHAVISCEGREKDAYELQDIAQQYLEKMGYAANPYLIYFHSDTPNNHVHIVSSRVNAEGRKIDDSFERIRSQKAMKEILLQDVGEEMRAHVKKALSYNFSTEAQFKLLLERQGVKAEDDGISYCFIKYGRIISALDKAEVTEKAARYAAPEARIKQLKALLAKYKPGLEEKEWRTLLHTKSGVELVFHQAEGKDTPYGYTLIDHANKQVLKGSQVMKLSELLHAAGPVSVEQRQAQRTEQASQWAITSQAEARILQRVFHLNADSLKVNSPKDEEALEYAADRLNSMLANGRSLNDMLQSTGWSIAKLDGQHYLIDIREKGIHPMQELTSRRLDYGSAPVLDLDRELSPQASRQLEHSSGSFTELLQLMAEGLQEGSRTTEQERKNKRRLKR